MFSGWKHWLWTQIQIPNTPLQTGSDYHSMVKGQRWMNPVISLPVYLAQQASIRELSSDKQGRDWKRHLVFSGLCIHVCKHSQLQTHVKTTHTHTRIHSHTYSQTHTNTQGHLHMHTKAHIQDTHTHFHITHQNSYISTLTIHNLDTHSHSHMHSHTHKHTNKSFNALTHTSHMHKENRMWYFLGAGREKKEELFSSKQCFRYEQFCRQMVVTVAQFKWI